MGKHRRQFSAALKAKIAVEAIKGQRTIQEIASSYSVHPNQITKWKKQLLDFSPEAFSAGRLQPDQADEQLKNCMRKSVNSRSSWTGFKKVRTVAVGERR